MAEKTTHQSECGGHRVTTPSTEGGDADDPWFGPRTADQTDTTHELPMPGGQYIALAVVTGVIVAVAMGSSTVAFFGTTGPGIGLALIAGGLFVVSVVLAFGIGWTVGAGPVADEDEQ